MRIDSRNLMRNSNSYTSGGDILAGVAEIGNFLNHAEGAYVVLKGRHHYLHPIGALYGPERPTGD